jgi:hypothetical protein
MITDQKEVSILLTAPFPRDMVHWKPIAIKGNRALAVAYLDARTVMQRLDQVLGVGGWKDAYQLLEGGSVLCILSIKVDGEWVQKSDVGSPSDQEDAGDKLKAAFSDALKRAACKAGIGRYLYRLPSQWVDYDPQRKAFVKTPSLPAWALPGAKTPAVNGQATNGSFLSTSPKTGDE